MSKWLCLGCEKQFEDEGLKPICVNCTRKAFNEIFKGYKCYEKSSKMQEMRMDNREWTSK